MPLYEYECLECHGRFERIQPVAAPPVMECPSCRAAVRRLLGSPALQFKGSGWYVTDYGNGRSRGTTETGNGGAAPSEAASNTGEDAGESAPKTPD